MRKFFKRSSRGRRARRPLRRSAVRRPKAQRGTRLATLRRMIPRVEVKEIRGSYTVPLGGVSDTQWLANGVQPLLMGPAATNYNTVQPDQGVGQGQRVGNRVTISRCVLRAVLYPLPYNAIFNASPKPMYVLIWLFKLKNANSEADSQAQAEIACQTGFFNDGNSVTGMTGTLLDLTLPINNDSIDVKKVYKLKLGTARIEEPSGTSVTYPSHFQNNDFKYNHTVTLNYTKYAQKRMVWNDAGAGGPRGMRQLWMCMSVVNADGSAIPSGAIPARIAYNLEFKYKDV